MQDQGMYELRGFMNNCSFWTLRPADTFCKQHPLARLRTHRGRPNQILCKSGLSPHSFVQVGDDCAGLRGANVLAQIAQRRPQPSGQASVQTSPKGL